MSRLVRAESLFTIFRSIEDKIARIERTLSYRAIPEVTAIPSGPLDGQEIYLRESGQSCLWHMRYEAGGDIWRFLGGTHFETYGAGGTPGGSYNTWQGIGSASYTVQFAGTYDVYVQCQFMQNQAAAYNDMRFGIGDGRGGARIAIGVYLAGAQFLGGPISGEWPLTLSIGSIVNTISLSLSNLSYTVSTPVIKVCPRYLNGV